MSSPVISPLVTVQSDKQSTYDEKLKKPRTRTLSRTISKAFIEKPQKKESPLSIDWQRAKELWPSSTGGVYNNTDYQKLKFTYCQIFPYLTSTGESIEGIFEEIEHRLTLQKLNVEWIHSNSAQSFEKFAQESALWQNFLKNRTP